VQKKIKDRVEMIRKLKEEPVDTKRLHRDSAYRSTTIMADYTDIRSKINESILQA
jgi:cell fate (sporulation/competence/biofilm development) regulator YmcA (YheA/YmcA/DUF963 family)